MESSISGGHMEFVLYMLDEVVCHITQSKTDVLADAIGQLYLELHGIIYFVVFLIHLMR